MNADEFEQLQNEQRRMEESIEESRKLSHEFQAECDEFYRTLQKPTGVRHGHE